MNKITAFKDLEVEILYAPKLKHSYLRVDADSCIIVKTPSRSQKYVLSFLEEKEAWIRKQLKKNEQNKQIPINLEDAVLLFGEVCSIDSKETEYLRKKLSKITSSSQEKVNAAYNDFYKFVSKIYLKERAEYFSQIMGLTYHSLKYRKMKSRWGSCSSKKDITFNTQLIKLNKELIDYVVVHELAHLVHMNHSKNFHTLVASYLPKAQDIRKKLKDIRLLD
ncbi:SprT family zinc-dependent metalloprotease [Sulfurimonas sp.]|uniref:M48 family metallopeptidase n=1 Tax=Sulfurimonas sp. TaxID=2022749 RepID=UPI0026381174|nr:SprT family zinc-dependent metalloprotease [Sulfurimonas sp.]